MCVWGIIGVIGVIYPLFPFPLPYTFWTGFHWEIMKRCGEAVLRQCHCEVRAHPSELVNELMRLSCKSSAGVLTECCTWDAGATLNQSSTPFQLQTLWRKPARFYIEAPSNISLKNLNWPAKTELATHGPRPSQARPCRRDLPTSTLLTWKPVHLISVSFPHFTSLLYTPG